MLWRGGGHCLEARIFNALVDTLSEGKEEEGVLTEKNISGRVCVSLHYRVGVIDDVVVCRLH